MGTSTHASGTAKNPILIIAGGVKMPEERSPSHILTKIRSADPATPLPPINKPKETFVPPVPPTEDNPLLLKSQRNFLRFLDLRKNLPSPFRRTRLTDSSTPLRTKVGQRSVVNTQPKETHVRVASPPRAQTQARLPPPSTAQKEFHTASNVETMSREMGQLLTRSKVGRTFSEYTRGAKPLDKTIISLLEIYAASNETSKLLEEQCKAVYKSSKQRRKTHKLAKRRKIDRDAEATTSKSTHGHRHQH
ncbi:hypothetical protein BGX33_007062 [Mortierella sp. NVP41]|nr:hypothetical protein BGX33_007062 [Mortierella sp. NVP41]